MKKWKVWYTDKFGDTAKCWVYADTPEEAKAEVMHEYWDVDTIDCVAELKD